MAAVVDALADELLVACHRRKNLDTLERHHGVRGLDRPQQFPMTGKQLAGVERMDLQGGDVAPE